MLLDAFKSKVRLFIFVIICNLIPHIIFYIFIFFCKCQKSISQISIAVVFVGDVEKGSFYFCF